MVRAFAHGAMGRRIDPSWSRTYVQTNDSPVITLIYIFYFFILSYNNNRNKVHDKFGIMYFEKLITMQIRSRD